MKLFTQGRYATVASTAALVVALGGTSYAAVKITSADIKDGTIQTKDLNASARTTAKQVQNENGTVMSGTAKTVLSLNLKKGNYVVTGKAYGPRDRQLRLRPLPADRTEQHGIAVDTSVVDGPATTRPVTAPWSTRLGHVTSGRTGTVQLNCYGSQRQTSTARS